MKFVSAHVSIRVFDLGKSLKFYEETLGMKKVRVKDYPDDFTLVFLEDQDGKYQLELTYNYNPEKPYEIGNGFSHLAFFVDELEEARDMFADKGYKVTKLMGLKGDKPNYFFVTDPDGYDVEIIRTK